MIASSVALVIVNHSFDTVLSRALLRPNPILWGVFAVASAILAITLYWKPARALLEFGAFHSHDALISASAGLTLLMLLGLLKGIFDPVRTGGRSPRIDEVIDRERTIGATGKLARASASPPEINEMHAYARRYVTRFARTPVTLHRR
jgi:hypothetical protein